MPDAPKATAKAASVLAGPGKAICEVRGRSYPLDAPPLIGGPNVEVNPVEAMVAALAACGTLFLQHLAQAMNVPLASVRAGYAGLRLGTFAMASPYSQYGSARASAQEEMRTGNSRAPARRILFRRRAKNRENFRAKKTSGASHPARCALCLLRPGRMSPLAAPDG